MPSISATAIQKTYKLESTTIFGEATYDSGTTLYSLITANGRSKGIASLVRDPATKHITITLDKSIPVKNWLGAQGIQIELATPAGTTTSVAAIIVNKTLSSALVAATIVFELVDKNDNAVDPNNGDKVLCTLHFTTSNVF